jgi:hypothetical protein
MERSEILQDPRHLGVPLGASKMIYENMVCSMQTMHLSCIELALSPKGPKQASTWASWPSGAIECVQKDLWAYGTSTANHEPTCTDTNTVSHRKEKRDSTWPTSPRGSIGCIQKWFPSLWFIRHKSCTYLASRLAISPNRPSFHWSLVSKEYIRCIQNNLWADAMFGTNCASICTDTNTISKRNEVRFEMTHVT